jgi:hypothetical protein
MQGFSECGDHRKVVAYLQATLDMRRRLEELQVGGLFLS